MDSEFKEAIRKSANAMYRSLPILLGVILLISLSNALVPKEVYTSFFRGDFVTDTFVGSVIGSILAGSPITSYILGGELLKQGVSLMAVTAFLVAWVTVGVVQYPAEAILLGKKFATVRNLVSFIFASLVAVATVSIISLI